MVRRGSQRGIALVIVLGVIVVVTILVVLLVTTMRMDREASFYNIERTRADFMAREGVETARALIVGATTNATDFWVSQPGQITLVGNPSGTNELFSGTGMVGNSNSVSINGQSWIATNDFMLDPGNPNPTNTNNYLLTWIYVNKNGTRSTTMTTNTVGRYAFWADDDSTRMDLNTAWGRAGDVGNTNTLANPNNISLDTLFSADDASAIHGYAATNFFSTPFDVLGLGSSVTNAAFQNRFSITHYTQDPDVNPWGQGRIVLTTQFGRANGRGYLNIAAVPGADIGLISSLGNGAMLNTNVLQPLAGTGTTASFTRSDWPYVTNSFSSKYGSSRILQMAVDIAEYARSAESSYAFIQPILGTPNGSGGLNLITNGSVTNIPAGALIGTVRRPMITEMGVSVPATTNASGVFPGTVYTELYLPTNYWTSSATCYLLTSVSSDGSTVTNVGPQGPYTITPPFLEITQTNFPIPPDPPGTTNRPGKVYLRMVALNANVDTVTDIFDAAPLSAASATNFISIPVPTGTNAISVVGVNDPRVNKFASDWQTVSTNATSWGSITNTPVWMKNIGATPPQDATTLGGSTISTAGLYMPAAGSVVGSVGELGYISTGAGTNGVPWRSVRLQPTPGGSTATIPDWALLDLFEAPVLSPTNNYLPAANEIAGRVNINAAIQPFTNVFRTSVLAALFTNVYTNAANTNAFLSVPAVVTNVLNRSAATDGVLYGNTNVYVSVGELSEIAGVSDGGKASEAVIRQVAGLATVRGDVFTVYSIGQALQWTPSGNLKVNGQKILQVTLERTLSSGTPSYRVIYWREVEP